MGLSARLTISETPQEEERSDETESPDTISADETGSQWVTDLLAASENCTASHCGDWKSLKTGCKRFARCEA
jgi:hypothetical protein